MSTASVWPDCPSSSSRSAFKSSVLDRIDFYQPELAWTPVAGDATGVQAAGSAATSAGGQQLTAAKGQFAASMAGRWVTVGAQTLRIDSVAADGSTLTVSGSWDTTGAKRDYRVHQARVKISTLGEFVDALNASGLLGDQRASYDAVSGDIRIPIRFAYALGLETGIDLGIGDQDGFALSTSAQGELDLQLDAGFDLIIDLGEGGFSLAIDEFKAQAALSLDVSDFAAQVGLGFVSLTAGGAGSGSGLQLDAVLDLALDRTPEAAGGARFTFGELVSEGLGSLRLDLSGSAYAGIKGLSASGSGVTVALAPDLEVALALSDLGDLGSLQVILPDFGALSDLGQIDIGGYPRPPVIYGQPILVERVPVSRPPVYLRVPPGHAKHWRKHCHEYRACGERVYFVQDRWYEREYVPRYQQRGRGDRDRWDDGRRAGYRDNQRDDRYERRGDDRRGDDRGRGHGHGHGHDR